MPILDNVLSFAEPGVVPAIETVSRAEVQRRGSCFHDAGAHSPRGAEDFLFAVDGQPGLASWYPITHQPEMSHLPGAVQQPIRIQLTVSQAALNRAARR